MNISNLPWVILDQYLETHRQAFYYPAACCRLESGGQLTFRGIHQEMPESTLFGTIIIVCDYKEGELVPVAIDPDDQIRQSMSPADFQRADFDPQTVKITYSDGDPENIEFSRIVRRCAERNGHCGCHR